MTPPIYPYSDKFSLQFSEEEEGKWKAEFTDGRMVCADKEHILFIEGKKIIVFKKEEWKSIMKSIEVNYPLHVERKNK